MLIVTLTASSILRAGSVITWPVKKKVKSHKSYQTIRILKLFVSSTEYRLNWTCYRSLYLVLQITCSVHLFPVTTVNLILKALRFMTIAKFVHAVCC